MEIAPEIRDRLTPLLDLAAKDCRWPIGDVGHQDFGFCADPAVDGRPYCEAHCARAFQTVAARREESKIARAPARAQHRGENHGEEERRGA